MVLIRASIFIHKIYLTLLLNYFILAILTQFDFEK